MEELRSLPEEEEDEEEEEEEEEEADSKGEHMTIRAPTSAETTDLGPLLLIAHGSKGTNHFPSV